MVSCKLCQTPNSLDSTFCKRCGTSIPQEDLNESSAKLEKLIEEGNALFNQGRTDEALAIAEAAVLANPSSSSALSLKTLCHERRGEIAEALETADKLVELNPGSDFDKIRRSALRQKLQADLHVPPPPDRRLAIIGGVSATVLVICLGAIAVRLWSPGSQLKQTPLTGDQAGAVVQNTQTTTQPTSNQSRMNPVPSTGQNQTSDDNSTPEATAPTPKPRSNSDQTSVVTPSPTGTGLPAVGNSSAGQIVPIDPVDSTDPSTGPAKPTPTKESNSREGNDPSPLVTTAPASTPPQKPEDPGIVSITVHSGPSQHRPTNSSSSTENMSNAGLETLNRVGSQQFQLGNYAAAAKSYEQAVRNGGDGIILNRRLAQAYERLGRSSDAAEAYRRCISSIDSALAAGHGNRDKLTSTRDLCQQALKVLGG